MHLGGAARVEAQQTGETWGASTREGSHHGWSRVRAGDRYSWARSGTDKLWLGRQNPLATCFWRTKNVFFFKNTLFIYF